MGLGGRRKTLRHQEEVDSEVREEESAWSSRERIIRIVGTRGRDLGGEATTRQRSGERQGQRGGVKVTRGLKRTILPVLSKLQFNAYYFSQIGRQSTCERDLDDALDFALRDAVCSKGRRFTTLVER